MIVWMPSLRKSIESRPAIYHYLRGDQRFSVCGRPAYAHGHKLTEEEAVEKFQAQRCRTCLGENPRYLRDSFTKKAA